MNWSKNKPNKPGWWWMRVSNRGIARPVFINSTDTPGVLVVYESEAIPPLLSGYPEREWSSDVIPEPGECAETCEKRCGNCGHGLLVPEHHCYEILDGHQYSSFYADFISCRRFPQFVDREPGDVCGEWKGRES